MTKQVGGQPPPRTEVRGLKGPLYHVWFSPKRRKHALLGDVGTALRLLITDIAREKGIEMLELEMAHDHVHLLIDVGPILSLPQTMQFLKGVSARRVFERFPELKLDLGHDHFWQRGYGFRHVNRGAARAIATYIRNHRNHDDLEPRTSVRGVAFPETNGGPHD